MAQEVVFDVGVLRVVVRLNARASWCVNCQGRCDLNGSTQHSFRLRCHPRSILHFQVFREEVNFRFVFLLGRQATLEVLLCRDQVCKVSHSHLNSSRHLPECLNWKLLLVCLFVLARLSKSLLSGDFWKDRVLGVEGKEWKLEREKLIVTEGHEYWAEKKGMEEST